MGIDKNSSCVRCGSPRVIDNEYDIDLCSGCLKRHEMEVEIQDAKDRWGRRWAQAMRYDAGLEE